MKICDSKCLGVAGAVLMLALLVGCGSGEDQGLPAGSAEPDSVANAGESAAVPPGPVDSCPFTAAEVSEVLGVAVQQDQSVCIFEPEPGKNPTVLYVRQVAFACSNAVITDPEFDMQPHEGLGIKAYASASGNHLLVCTNPPFEITVDITPSLDALVADSEAASSAARASERAATEQLARLLLDR